MRREKYDKIFKDIINRNSMYVSTVSYVEGRGLENDPYGINQLNEAKDNYFPFLLFFEEIVTIPSSDFIFEFLLYYKDNPLFKEYKIKELEIGDKKVIYYAPEEYSFSSLKELIDDQNVVILCTEPAKNILYPALEMDQNIRIPCLSLLSPNAKNLYMEKLSRGNKKYKDYQDFMIYLEEKIIKKAHKQWKCLKKK